MSIYRYVLDNLIAVTLKKDRFSDLKTYSVQDTNLNSAPENWLKSNLAGRFYDGSIKKRKPIDLSRYLCYWNFPLAVYTVLP